MGRARRTTLSEPACYHLTHRCQERRFLLKFALDRRDYVKRLRQMVAGYRVSALDYMVTCNHVHLLLWARRGGDVAAALHLLQGNTTRDYNRRKGREGSSWRGRYHPTLIESGRHLSSRSTHCTCPSARGVCCGKKDPGSNLSLDAYLTPSDPECP